MAPEVLVEPGEPELEQSHLALADLGRDDGRRGQQVAEAENEEDQADARNVPGGVISGNFFKFKVYTTKIFLVLYYLSLHFLVKYNLSLTAYPSLIF